MACKASIGLYGLYATLETVPDSRDVLSKLPDSAKVLNGTVIDVIDAFKDSDSPGIPLYYNDPGNGNPPIISSLGPDGLPNTADDIYSTDF